MSDQVQDRDSGSEEQESGSRNQEAASAPAGQNSEPEKKDQDSQDEWGSAWKPWTGEEDSATDAGGAASGTEESGAEKKAESRGQELEAEKTEDSAATMGLLDHLNELRSRLIKATIAVAAGFAICWAFVDQLFNFLLAPLLAALPEGTHAQYTTLPEAFFTRMLIAFVAGAFIASPVIFYQIWAFVAPGLYDEEKRHVIPIAALSAIFFIAGGIFCYLVVFPFAFNFFISYSTPEIVMTPRVSDYLSFTLKLIFAFGLIFEMPIFTFFLARLGIITAAMMRSARRYAIVAIFIIAAILTPPDVMSQLLMACPMLLLYEVSIGVAAIFGRKRKPKSSDQDDE